jgi:WhiB family redox-sensing transcriptional regulator
MDTDWMGQGRCKDMDPAVFFPSDWMGVQSAQRVCADCTVSRQCLSYALASRITDGVWGGTSERHRVRLLRSRATTRIPAFVAALDHAQP